MSIAWATQFTHKATNEARRLTPAVRTPVLIFNGAAPAEQTRTVLHSQTRQGVAGEYNGRRYGRRRLCSGAGRSESGSGGIAGVQVLVVADGYAGPSGGGPERRVHPAAGVGGPGGAGGVAGGPASDRDRGRGHADI